MIHSGNLQDLLQQSTRPVSTTSKSILAATITLPNGSILSAYTTSGPQSPKSQFDIKKVKLIALFIHQQLLTSRLENGNAVNTGRSDSNLSNAAAGGLSESTANINNNNNNNNNGGFVGGSEGLLKFEKVDQDLEVYVHDIEHTELKVLLVTEVGYPDGIIKLKVDQLLNNLKDLEEFEYIED